MFYGNEKSYLKYSGYENVDLTGRPMRKHG